MNCLFCVLMGLCQLLSPAAALSMHPLWLPQSSMRVATLAQSLVIQSQPSSQSIQQAVVQDLAQRTGQPLQTFKVIHIGQQTWPDGCLGLSEPDVLCTMALVPGWRVVVSNGAQEWTYRTDDQGQIIKLDPGQSSQP